MNNLPLSDPTTFIITKEYRLFMEFCEACRRYRYIGLCFGVPGVGKTLSARHYAQWGLIEEFAQFRHEHRPSPPELKDCHAIFYTPTVANTPRSIDRELSDWCSRFRFIVWDARYGQELENKPQPWEMPDLVQLVIVDEADRLKMQSLEHLRDMYDRGRFGLILIGMPGIEKRMSRYPQLYSRVGFVHRFKTLSSEEMQFILAHKWQQLGLILDTTDFTDHEAISTIINITGGNFRLVQRLFSQIERILEINELQTVTKQVVETARESLVIGNV